MNIIKKSLLSLLTILGIIGLVIGVTNAFFSDTETSAGNVLQAGKIDLQIDNSSYYNGQPSPDTSWDLDDLTDHLFFNFEDLKPGDWGEDTISLHVDDNDAWACMEISLTEDDDESCNEPELGDDPTCNDPDDDGADGELANSISFVFWADDGDNVLEDDEDEGIFKQGTTEDVFDGTPIALADAADGALGLEGPLTGGETYYIAKAWCFGELTLDPVPQGQGENPTVDPGISCDGSGVNNASQTDKVLVDFAFSAVQSRNNEQFSCSGVTPSVTPSISVSPSPTPIVCGQADVILVLDRSGSINSSELTTLKTAAKDFVDTLGLSTTGIHAGASSFATSGTLNQHLTDNGVTLKASIDALISGGFTNLSSGINLAKTELDNPGDGHDRADISSPDKMIVITDGHPNRPLPSGTADDLAATAADAARAAGVEIFVVGVGADVNTAFLQNEIADNAAHYFSVSDYNGLKTTLGNLDLCDD